MYFNNLTYIDPFSSRNPQRSNSTKFPILVFYLRPKKLTSPCEQGVFIWMFTLQDFVHRLRSYNHLAKLRRSHFEGKGLKVVEVDDVFPSIANCEVTFPLSTRLVRGSGLTESLLFLTIFFIGIPLSLCWMFLTVYITMPNFRVFS